jgi:hypothetical protein
MKAKGKRFISLVLIFSLMMLSANLYAKERRGAKLIVTKKNGYQTEGELITVKPNSLLLLDTEGKDVSVSIADINVIRIVKKSKALLGAGLGFLIGAGVGAIVGLVADKVIDLGDYIWGPQDSALLGGAIGGTAGALGGGFIGASAGKNVTIQIEGMTDFKIQETLDKLRKKARIRDYK